MLYSPALLTAFCRPDTVYICLLVFTFVRPPPESFTSKRGIPRPPPPPPPPPPARSFEDDVAPVSDGSRSTCACVCVGMEVGAVECRPSRKARRRRRESRLSRRFCAWFLPKPTHYLDANLHGTGVHCGTTLARRCDARGIAEGRRTSCDMMKPSKRPPLRCIPIRPMLW
jgi:hypothetical protein